MNDGKLCEGMYAHGKLCYLKEKYPTFCATGFTVIKELFSSVYVLIELLENDKGATVVRKTIHKHFKSYEVDLLLKANSHPNFVQLLGYEPALGLKKKSVLYMEFCPNLDLFEFQGHPDFRDGMPEPIIRPIFLQILEGVSYLHSINIAHRDLKPENIFMVDDKHIKIGDFGHATSFKPHEWFTTRSVGTLEYIAPEVILGRCHNFKIDIWSMGVILFTLYNLYNPFLKTTVKESVDAAAYRKQVNNNITHRKYWFYRPPPPPDAFAFIQRMLNENPISRPTCDELKKEPADLERVENFK